MSKPLIQLCYFQIALILCCAVLALASASGYGYGGYGGNGGPRGGYGGYSDYKFNYDVQQGDYNAKAKFQHYQDPYTFNYNVYQTHPYGGHSRIYHTQSQKQGYGYH